METKDIDFRIAGPQDRMHILRLREAVYLTEQRRIAFMEDMASFDKYHEFATYFIAFVDGVAVGTSRVIADSTLGLPCEAGADLSALRADNRLVEIGHCITLPEQRWRGVGLRLMRKAFDYGVEHLHATQVLIDFFVDRPESGSAAFHRALGFRPLGKPYRDSRFRDSPESVVAVLAVEEALRRRARIAAGRNVEPAH